MHDSQVANDLIEVIQEAQYFIADKGYDSQEIRDKAIEHGMKAIIPKRKNAKQPNPDFDSYLYKLRHLVENAFARLKQFRSIATRYEKLARNFKSMLYLACSIIHAKLNWGHALVGRGERSVIDLLAQQHKQRNLNLLWFLDYEPIKQTLKEVEKMTKLK